MDVNPADREERAAPAEVGVTQRCLSTVETVEKSLTRSSQAKGQASLETQKQEVVHISLSFFFLFLLK